MRKVWGAGGGRLRWQVGKAGGVLVRDARVTGGEEGEKADGEAGEARGRAAGMGRDGRGGLGWRTRESTRRLAEMVRAREDWVGSRKCEANGCTTVKIRK